MHAGRVVRMCAVRTLAAKGNKGRACFPPPTEWKTAFALFRPARMSYFSNNYDSVPHFGVEDRPFRFTINHITPSQGRPPLSSANTTICRCPPFVCVCLHSANRRLRRSKVIAAGELSPLRLIFAVQRGTSRRRLQRRRRSPFVSMSAAASQHLRSDNGKSA